MADERDPRISQHYRELGGEGPSRELDQAILAAAHRAAERQHAPLVTPAGRHRWYFSLAAAAILVLAVGIALHVDQRPPDTSEAVATPPPAPEPQAPRKEALAKPDAPARAVDDVAVLQERRAAPQRAPAAPPASNEAKPSKESALMKDRGDAPPAQPAASAPGERRAEVSSDAAAAAPAPLERAKTRLAARAETPEAELERIAELRRLGRDEEADKALAEFRKRYPDYQITAETRAKVERPA